MIAEVDEEPVALSGTAIRISLERWLGKRPEKSLKTAETFEENTMLKNYWVKWGLLVAGSTVAALSMGNCVAQLVWQSLILRAVN